MSDERKLDPEVHELIGTFEHVSEHHHCATRHDLAATERRILSAIAGNQTANNIRFDYQVGPVTTKGKP